MQWLRNFVNRFLNPRDNDLENFIMSKRPMTISDVEHWVRVYQSRKTWC